MSVGQELLNVPFAEMTEKLALAVAKSQTRLDMNSTKVAKFMSETTIDLPDIANPSSGSKSYPLIALGFFPGFYQFTEAEIEVKMAITMARTREFGLSAEASVGIGPFSASVNASYKSKYNYSQEGSSRLTVKLAPAPPPTILEQYMNKLIEVQGAQLEQDANPAPSS